MLRHLVLIGSEAFRAEYRVYLEKNQAIDLQESECMAFFACHKEENIEKEVLVITDSDTVAQELKKQQIPYAICGEATMGKYYLESPESLGNGYETKLYNRQMGLPCSIAKTERLLIRETTVEDVEEFYRIYAEPSITAYMENLYENPEEEREFTRAYIEQMYGFFDYGMWTVCLGKRVIGRVGICHREIDGEPQLELGYVIEKEFQRKGYGLEACQGAIQYAFEELEADYLNAFTMPENKASVALLEKLGFQFLEEVELDAVPHKMYRLNRDYF